MSNLINSSKRVVFLDETCGNVVCHSNKCDWEGDSEFLYKHYKQNHNEEFLTTDDKILKWKYELKELPNTISRLAWIEDRMFWIHTKVDAELLHIALQLADFGDFIYNIRTQSDKDDLGIGNMDTHSVLRKDVKNVFDHPHYSVPITTLEKLVTPEFILTLDKDKDLDNMIAEMCSMYLEDGDYKYECSAVPYECISMGQDFVEEYKCIVCEDSEVHISQLTLCDDGHSICLDCKKSVDACPFDSCCSRYSSEYKNPAVERVVRLLGLEGIPYSM